MRAVGGLGAHHAQQVLGRAEAARLGFTHALVPSDPGKIPDGMRVLEVADVGAALSVLPKRVRREAPQEEGARR